MTQYAKQQTDKNDIFLKAMGTLTLFGGVILLDQLVERWFPTLKLINAFSTILIFTVWAIFVYFCLKFYRASKFAQVAKTTFPNKQTK